MKKTGNDWAKTQFTDSFATAELIFPQASIIGLLLFDSTALPGEPGHRELPFRFRIPANRARELAKALLETVDEIEGNGRRRQ
ncbi:MAG: hypothetical protein BGP11_06175 [Rhodobacterales bacterium 65-51]|uniref:hypothetical protein n=1 Tax=uncultured Gemmobacter sp. TaxID=1095917 RepID=UPI00095BDF84|nr:hypothetical protein [uncultured Gemmobacter sp.]OJY25370.1 MAG: hypothetical protein BGP11_06175 [Rhodobacterales bacterium 65-51]